MSLGPREMEQVFLKNRFVQVHAHDGVIRRHKRDGPVPKPRERRSSLSQKRVVAQTSPRQLLDVAGRAYLSLPAHRSP